MKKKKVYERPLIKPIVATMPGKSGNNVSLPLVSEIDGHIPSSLLKKFGSPLFLFSESTLRNNFKEAKNTFLNRYPNVCFAWSYKTNYLDAICKIFHEEGAWAEVVSGFEYKKALQNGVRGTNIIFNGPNKSEADLLLAIDNESLIHIDNLQELILLSHLAEKSNKNVNVAIRINLDAEISPAWSRFGFNLENGEAWRMVTKIIQEKRLNLKGLHCHIGTFILSLNAYKVQAKKMAVLAEKIYNELHHSIAYLDLGGGFASKNTLKGSYLSGEDCSPSISDYARVITDELKENRYIAKFTPLLLLETGRALVDDAGFLLTSVVANKRNPDGRLNTIVDAGVNILFTSFWYNHKISATESRSSHWEDSTLYGPLCMNIDVLRERVALPLLNKGDVLIIHNVGAYNVTQSMQFISYRPAVVLLDKNCNAKIIREADDFEYVTCKEHYEE